MNILQIPLSSEITIIWILKSKLTKLSSLTNIVVKNNKQTTCIIINVLKKAQLKGFANRGTQIVEGEDNISRSKTNISSNRHATTTCKQCKGQVCSVLPILLESATNYYFKQDNNMWK